MPELPANDTDANGDNERVPLSLTGAFAGSSVDSHVLSSEGSKVYPLMVSANSPGPGESSNQGVDNLPFHEDLNFALGAIGEPNVHHYELRDNVKQEE